MQFDELIIVILLLVVVVHHMLEETMRLIFSLVDVSINNPHFLDFINNSTIEKIIPFFGILKTLFQKGHISTILSDTNSAFFLSYLPKYIIPLLYNRFAFFTSLTTTYSHYRNMNAYLKLHRLFF